MSDKRKDKTFFFLIFRGFRDYSAQVKDPTTAIALTQISFCRSAFAYFYTKTRGIAPICMYLITYLVTFLKFLILKF